MTCKCVFILLAKPVLAVSMMIVGGQCLSSSESDAASAHALGLTPRWDERIPADFKEILDAAKHFEVQLGGAPHYPGGVVCLAGKKTKKIAN